MARSKYPSKLNHSQINEGDFLIWGNNGTALIDIIADSIDSLAVQNISKSIWLMRTTGNSYRNIFTQVVLNTKGFDSITNVNLVINRYGNIEFPADSSVIIAPDSIDSTGNYYFNEIYWDPDSSGIDVFGFQVSIERSSNKSSIENSESNNSDATNPEGIIDGSNSAVIACSMFPNPTSREYTITVRLSSVSPVKISLQDENGKQLKQYDREGALEYSLNGVIDKTGCYFVTVTTDQESKTYKLIVQ